MKGKVGEAYTLRNQHLPKRFAVKMQIGMGMACRYFLLVPLTVWVETSAYGIREPIESNICQYCVLNLRSQRISTSKDLPV